MKRTPRRPSAEAFTLIEVVLAIGIVAFALFAIIGLIPLGLQVGRSSVEDTRANQVAEQVFTTLRKQNFENVDFYGQTLNLAELNTGDWSVPTVRVSADNDGNVTALASEHPYSVELRFLSTPAGLPPGWASEVHVTVRTLAGPTHRSQYVSVVGR